MASFLDLGNAPLNGLLHGLTGLFVISDGLLDSLYGLLGPLLLLDHEDHEAGEGNKIFEEFADLDREIVEHPQSFYNSAVHFPLWTSISDRPSIQPT